MRGKLISNEHLARYLQKLKLTTDELNFENFSAPNSIKENEETKVKCLGDVMEALLGSIAYTYLNDLNDSYRESFKLLKSLDPEYSRQVTDPIIRAVTGARAIFITSRLENCRSRNFSILNQLSNRPNLAGWFSTGRILVS